MSKDAFSKSFPFSFIFFHKLLEKKSPLSLVNFIFIGFSYTQLFCCSLSPIIIAHKLDNTKFISESRIILSILTINTNPFEMSNYLLSYLVFLFVSILIFGFILMMYVLFKHHHKLPNILVQTKGLLWLC